MEARTLIIKMDTISVFNIGVDSFIHIVTKLNSYLKKWKIIVLNLIHHSLLTFISTFSNSLSSISSVFTFCNDLLVISLLASSSTISFSILKLFSKLFLSNSLLFLNKAERNELYLIETLLIINPSSSSIIVLTKIFI